MYKKIIIIIIFVFNVYSMNEEPEEMAIYVHGTGATRWTDPFINESIPTLEKKIWKKNFDGRERETSLGRGEEQLIPGLKGYNKTVFNSYFGMDNVQDSFRWPEGLSSQYRKLGGKKLYEAICSLKKETPNIRITLFAHSHGGNVIAEAIRCAKEKNDEGDDFKIDKVVFLETPIYEVTESAIHMKKANNEYYIENVYNVVVGKDPVQVIDMVTGHFPFCRRVFKKERDEGKKIVNIHAEKANDHNDAMSMIEAYKQFIDQEGFAQLSNEVYNQFDLKGGWYIFHEYGSSVMKMGCGIIVLILLCKSMKKFNYDCDFLFKEGIKKIKMYFNSLGIKN